MKRGTLSLLIGAHQFIVHPIAVTIAWRKLYGRWPDLSELVCIGVHDWGYWGCSDMDGPEGIKHPELGSDIANKLFGTAYCTLCYYHSRFLAKRDKQKPSKLCWADKLGTAITPWWLYLPGAWLSGELEEYRWQAAQYHAETGNGIMMSSTNREWFQWMTAHLRKVALQRKEADWNR